MDKRMLLLGLVVVLALLPHVARATFSCNSKGCTPPPYSTIVLRLIASSSLPFPSCVPLRPSEFCRRLCRGERPDRVRPTLQVHHRREVLHDQRPRSRYAPLRRGGVSGVSGF